MQISEYCIFMRDTFVFQVFPEANRAGLIGDSFNLARFFFFERERESNLFKKQIHSIFSICKCQTRVNILHFSQQINFRAKLLHYDVALNMTTYLKYERGYAPWTAFVDSVEYIRSSISKSGAYVLMQVC